jgi:hypothetical protein
VSGQLHAPAALSRRKNFRYPLSRRLSRPQSRCECGGEEKKSHHCICRELKPGRPARIGITLTEHHSKKAYSGSGGIAPSIRNLGTIDGGEWSASRPGRIILWETASGTPCIRGWMGPRAGPDAVVKRKIPSPCQVWNP